MDSFSSDTSSTFNFNYDYDYDYDYNYNCKKYCKKNRASSKSTIACSETLLFTPVPYSDSLSTSSTGTPPITRASCRQPPQTTRPTGIILISKVKRLMLAALKAATLGLLILTLSNWIALASAAVVPVARPLQLSGSVSDEDLDLTSLKAFQFDALVLDANSDEKLASESKSAEVTVGSAIEPLDILNSSALLAAVVASSTNGSQIYGEHGFAPPPPPQPPNQTTRSAGGTTTSTGITTTTTAVAGQEPFLDGSHGNGSLVTAETETRRDFVMPPFHTILVCILLLLVIIGTVVGNILVCIAVCMVRKLRRPCNYLLVSLALSDLCVAVLVMPMALLYEVLEKWNFGPLLCDIWVSFDVLCCTASILNLCAISVDRYMAITKPLEYGVKRTPRRMMACVALVWLAAACISLPPLLILGNEHEGEHGAPICTVCQNFAYQIYATLGSFYIPLAVMLFVYYQIFRAARRIVLEEKRAQTHLQNALNGTRSPPAGNTELAPSGNGQRHSSCGNTSLSYSTCGGVGGHGGAGGGGSGGGVSGSTGLLGSPHQKKLRFQLAKEKKASTTLGIIMSAFTICWLPFFILALIRPFVDPESVPQSLSSLFLWLGYANSLLNPIIYATLNRDFRKPFQEILYFRCSSLNTMMRENYYQDQYGEPPSQRVVLGDERHGARESFL